MKYIILFSLFCFSISTFAQQGFVAIGGDMQAEGVTMSFSTGQTDFNFIYTNSHSLQFGLQQVFPPSTVKVETVAIGAPDFNVFPNPTSGRFNLELINYGFDQMILMEIYSIRGELIRRMELQPDIQHIISLEGQLPGIYMLRLMQGSCLNIKKIIKN
jgi:hypothetical protein